MTSSFKKDRSFFSNEVNKTDENDCPLHLIEAIESDANENYSSQPLLKLNEKALQTVLKSCEGRKLSVIAVVGPPACGKSLLLNFIKSALEEKECRNKNLTRSNKSQCFKGFKYNSAKNSKSCTTGIWVWSRAFLPLENEIAVILLDTQGLTSSEASSAIFGLSFLTSSTLIYNIEASAFETSRFSPLSPYFKYGFGCLEKDEELSEEEPPFQTLAFLFRDWSDVGTYPYGREGGKSFLNSKLETLRGRLKNETKEGLKCFQQVTPYLIPQMSGFPGSRQDVNQEFLIHLEKFVGSLLDDENLIPKQIFGVELNPDNFTNFLKGYVKTYNNLLHKKGKLIEEEIILEATCTTFHQNIVNKCLKKYNEIFEKRSQTLNNPNQYEIQCLHDFAARQANIIFNIEKKLPDHEEACHKELEKALSSIIEKKTKETSSNRDKYIQTCLDKATANFKTKLLKVSRSRPSPELLGKLKESAISEFLSNFSSDDDENTLELANSLENQLEKVVNTFQQEEDGGNGGKLENVKGNQLEKSKQEANYKIQNEIKSESNRREKEELAQPFKNEAINRQRTSNFPPHHPGVKNVPKRFSEQSPFPPGSAAREELERKLGFSPVNKSTPVDKNTPVEKSMSPKEIKQACLKQYETEMNTFLKSVEFIETEKLAEAHQISEGKVLSMFERLSKAGSVSTPENRGAESLKRELEKKFAKMKNESQRQVEVAQANATKWIQECYKEYQIHIEKIADSCINTQAYQQAHDKIKNEIFIIFSKKWKYNPSTSFQQKEIKELESEMDAAYEELETFFRMRQNTDLVLVEELKTEARKYYHAEMSKQIKPKNSHSSHQAGRVAQTYRKSYY
ncbi:unnamed protein product [Orchesella dallaii]|uniref:GB1/RHD3-type G domain-containing protein n=1 Tax=Orchesella dallaii TaxID=48710 RepID=A0ABP1RV24_9HEXA